MTENCEIQHHPLALAQEEGPEAPREDPHRQEEAGAASDPAVRVRGQAATGDDAVQMGVELELLAQVCRTARKPMAAPRCRVPSDD